MRGVGRSPRGRNEKEVVPDEQFAARPLPRLAQFQCGRDYFYANSRIELSADLGRQVICPHESDAAPDEPLNADLAHSML